MNKINFLEKKNVTYIIIAIFVVFALIHLYKINSNTTEPFGTIGENSNVANGVFIDIPGLNQVRFNNEGLNTLLDNKADASALAGKADASALQLKADINDVSVLTTKVGGLTSNVATLMTNPSIPDYTIFEYAGPLSSIPAGWQLCDGKSLKYANTNTNVMIVGVDMSISKKTPNLNTIQILNPAETNRWYSNSYDGVVYGRGRSGSNNQSWTKSDLFSRTAWHAPIGESYYMRIKLDNVYNIYGIIIRGRGENYNDYIKTLEAYVSSVSIDSLNWTALMFLESAYEDSKNIPNEIRTSSCFISGNKTLNTNLTKDTSLNGNLLKFDTILTGNYLTIKPKTGGRDGVGAVRVALIVKPINQYIIKQPTKV